MKRNSKIQEMEIDMNELFTNNSTLNDYFYLKELEQRKLFLNEDISQFSVCEIVKNILEFNKEDKNIEVENRKPIFLYITSNGGDVDSGFELIDVIIASKTPIYTINLGYQYSMAFLIGLAGHKRYANKNATFLHHDGSSMAYDSSTKLQDRMEFNKKTEIRIKEYVLNKSNITSEEYDSKLRVEWYMFADEAKQKGFVDFIIGEDCDMDEII